MKRKAGCGVVIAVILLIILLLVLLGLRACEADTDSNGPVETTDEPTETEQDIAEVADMLEAIFTVYDLGVAEPLLDFYPRNTSEWFAVGGGGTFARTTDAGGTWVSQQVPEVSDAFRAAALYWDGSWFMMAGDGGRAYGTENGDSFQEVPVAIPGTVNDIFFSGSFGWILGDDFIRHTGDNGLTWHDQFDVPPLPLGSSTMTMTLEAGHFHAGPDFTGWAVGDGGIATTDDGGFTFELQAHPGAHFLDVFSTDPENVWVSGKDGLLWGSADGGTTWAEQTVPTENDLYAIAFVDENYGFTVDLKGGLYTTIDGGASWDPRTYAGGPSFEYSAVRAAVFPSDGDLPRLRVWGTGPAGQIGELDASFGEIFSDGFESGDTSAWSN